MSAGSPSLRSGVTPSDYAIRTARINVFNVSVPFCHVPAIKTYKLTTVDPELTFTTGTALYAKGNTLGASTTMTFSGYAIQIA